MKWRAQLMSSKACDWRTPQEICDLVAAVAPIGLDPCAHPKGLVDARKRIMLPTDGLTASWYTEPGELVYCNPPYGRTIGKWLARCAQMALAGRAAIALVPARTDTRWWHARVTSASAVCFIRGRLQFVGAKSGAPFPSALIYWGRNPARFVRLAMPVGWTVLT